MVQIIQNIRLGGHGLGICWHLRSSINKGTERQQLGGTEKKKSQKVEEAESLKQEISAIPKARWGLD